MCRDLQRSSFKDLNKNTKTKISLKLYHNNIKLKKYFLNTVCVEIRNIPN